LPGRRRGAHVRPRHETSLERSKQPGDWLMFAAGKEARVARAKQLLKQLAEPLCVAEAAQFGERLELDLADPLTRDAELLSDL